MARRAPAMEIRGIRELQAALRSVDKSLPKQMRVAGMKAAEVSAVRARSLASGASRMAAKAAPSIKASAEQRAAKLTFGGKQYPFAAGANWGSGHDQKRSVSGRSMVGWNQFPEFTKNDRFIYRAIHDTTPEPFMSGYVAALDEIVDTIARKPPSPRI